MTPLDNLSHPRAAVQVTPGAVIFHASDTHRITVPFDTRYVPRRGMVYEAIAIEGGVVRTTTHPTLAAAFAHAAEFLEAF